MEFDLDGKAVDARGRAPFLPRMGFVETQAEPQPMTAV
jgi:hypothetical protein